MGGKEAAEKILAIDPTARLIVSSGYSAGSELARYQELGFAARLEKPFTLSKLESVVLQVAS
jgi:CheY-like chemotaxis protein